MLRPTTSILMRLLARTPEAWVGATIAACGVATVATAWPGAGGVDGVRLAAAILVGAVAQAASGAVAMLPGAVPGTGPGSRPGLAASFVARICWPLGGAGLAALVGRQAAGGAGWEPIAGVVSVAAVATAALATACSRRAVPSADAVSIALTAAAVAAAAAAACSPALPAAIAAWSAAACCVGLLPRSAVSPGSSLARHVEQPALAGALLAHGPVRAALSTIAMVTSLAGMVAWFFLDPASGARYPLLAAAWFVCLAVPQAASLSAAGRAGALGRSAAGADGAWRTPAARWARVSAASHALVLGWPAVVAVGLYGGGAFARGELAVWPIATAAGLAVAAGVLTVLCGIGVRFAWRPDCIRAVALAVVAAAALAVFASLPLLPALLDPPSFLISTSPGR